MPDISMQEFADLLGVSRISVWKALNNRPGVSDKLRKEILQKAAEHGFIPPEQPRKTVSVAIAQPDSSGFWMQIVHHIAMELAHFDVDLIYTYLPPAPDTGYHLPNSLKDTSGLIVINVYNEELLHMLSRIHVPKVFLDTVPTVPFSSLNGDLLLLEGREAVCKLTARLLNSGRKTLGFIGDSTYAQTNMDRYLGFLDAHQGTNTPVDPRFTLSGTISPSAYAKTIGLFLDSLETLPEAFVCVSDFVAHLVLRHLHETNRQLPEKFVVTGFDNENEFENTAGIIPTVDVQTNDIGFRLARRLLFLIDYPNVSHELSYITSQVLYRGI